MLKVLLKKQLAEIFRVYFYNPKSNKRRSVGSTVGFFVFYVFLYCMHKSVPTRSTACTGRQLIH